jgi:hypothetical protein
MLSTRNHSNEDKNAQTRDHVLSFINNFQQETFALKLRIILTISFFGIMSVEFLKKSTPYKSRNRNVK